MLPRPSTTHTYSSTGAMEARRRTGSIWRKSTGPLRRRRSSPETGIAELLDFRPESDDGRGKCLDNALGSVSFQDKRGGCEAVGGCATQDAPARMGIGRKVASRVVHKAADIARVLTPRRNTATDSRTEPEISLQHDVVYTSRPTSKGAAGRLRLAFPEIGAAEADAATNFMCSLDHARIRWYGRMYVCNKAVCFVGMGVSLSAATFSSKAADPLPELLVSSERPRSRSHTQWLESFHSMPRDWSAEDVRERPKRWSLGQASHVVGSCPNGRRPWHRTSLRIAFRDITRVSKESTLALWPNALTIATGCRHYIFTNLVRRDRAYSIIEERWHSMQDTSTTALPTPLPRRRLDFTTKRPVSIAVPFSLTPEQPVSTSSKPRIHTTTKSTGETGSEPTVCDQPEIGLPPASSMSNGAAVVLCKQQEPVLAAVVWYEQQRRCNDRQPLRDPIVLMLQTVGQISRNTLFVLVSVVVLCLLSSLTFW